MTTSTDAAAGRFGAARRARPGKIIAVHLSYASRADQRGRRPAAPVVLLQAVELGRGIRRHDRAPRRHRAARLRGRDRARHRHRRRGASRSRTRGATSRGSPPPNDFGLYDLRANDKGSNVRSKGGDGFTPIGPTLHRRPRGRPGARCALRTWVNGELAQDDTTAGLHLPARPARRRPLAALHARARRRHPHRHARRLLGRRAGRRRRGRGRRARARALDLGPPRHDGDAGRRHPSTRRSARSPPSTTRSAPRRGALARPRACRPGDRPAAGDRRRSPARARSPTGAARRSSLRAPVAGLSAQLRKRGLNNVTIDGVRPMHPGTKIVGTAQDPALRARTARTCSPRHGGGYNAQKRAFDTVGEGEVIVIEARGETGSGTLGDILALRAHARGAAGIVTDGGVRDYDAVAAHRHPGVLRRRAPRRARPQARAVGRRRDDRMRRHDRAAGRHHRRRRATA